MVLFFFRHGSAGKPHTDVRADRKRSLDREGVLQCEAIGKALTLLGERIDFVASSPLQRARQSARLVAREIGFRKRIRLSSALLPAARYQEFLRLLSKFEKSDRLLLAGHNARLSEFLGKLISPPGSRAAVDLKKGALAKVRLDRHGAVLQWVIHPGLLPPGPNKATGFQGKELKTPGRRRGAARSRK